MAMTMVGDISGTSTVKSRKGATILIPNHYLPPRMWRMWKRKEIAAIEAYGAAMYVYFVKNQWMLWGGGTNYRVEFVSGGRSGGVGNYYSLHIKRDIKAVLDYALIEEGKFAETPGVDYELNRTARHHQGKEIIAATLRRFARIAKIGDTE
jgi:hypothetical protein